MITNCAHCAFWVKTQNATRRTAECRINPPVVILMPENCGHELRTIFPITLETEGCGKGSPYLCIEPGCNAPATDDYNERCFECRSKHEDEQESDDYLGDGIFAANH